MAVPHVGEPADPMHAADGGCLYCGEKAGDPRCTQPASTHLMVFDGRQVVQLAACPTHTPIARAVGGVLREHDHEAICGMPGSIWLDPPENRCVLDVSGVEPGLVLVGEMTRCR